MGRPGVIAFPVLLVLGAITGILAYNMLIVQSTPVVGSYAGSPYYKGPEGAQGQNAAPAESATVEEQSSEETPAAESATTGEQPAESVPAGESQGSEIKPAAATINAEIVPGALNKSTDAYSPNPIQANVGDTVVWTNKDTTIHTVTSGTPTDGPDGLFGAESSDLIFANAKFQYTFETAGEFPYYCTLHPAMVGKVVVP